ncbi:Gep5p SCDLUD_001702 [Saccharomycodes ludwigii]|uniref:Gep5p n=1 Tax=Saccharomycodes ludwigii TaxID=36035 RepID=UPI001E85A8BC|nr:hypothetical protein SCDLUD_001702 [Saccharomycodes ludwigii]KAH3901918.1 hypothetical protein SCDLUD_001702 [Saccharomycodes ludwigii]
MIPVTKETVLNSLCILESQFHYKTLDHLENFIINSTTKRLSIANAINQILDCGITTAQGTKLKSRLLWLIYYQWLNKSRNLPHIAILRSENIHDLVTHWPYERDHDFLIHNSQHMETKNEKYKHNNNSSHIFLRDMWKSPSNLSKRNLEKLQNWIQTYSSKPWLLEYFIPRKDNKNVKKVKKSRTSNVSTGLDTITFDDLKVFQNESDMALITEKQYPAINTLNEIHRDDTIRNILQHFLFLRMNSLVFNMGSEKSLDLSPIVYIPMNPLGLDIPGVRIKNIFRRKINELYEILAYKFPAITAEIELELQEILGSDTHNISKKSKNLYKGAIIYSGTYLVTDRTEHRELVFKISSLMNRI